MNHLSYFSLIQLEHEQDESFILLLLDPTWTWTGWIIYPLLLDPTWTWTGWIIYPTSPWSNLNLIKMNLVYLLHKYCKYSFWLSTGVLFWFTSSIKVLKDYIRDWTKDKGDVWVHKRKGRVVKKDRKLETWDIS